MEKIKKYSIEIILVIVFFINIMYLSKIGYIKQVWIDEIKKEPVIFSNLIDNYYRQTFAFAHGQLSFVEDTSNLKELNNPYDIKERFNKDYLFDTSYYNGKYYSYYTILPIIFILLPLYLLTGKFLNLVIVNWIILSLGVWVISRIYKLAIKKYVGNINLGLYILGFITILFGSNMFMLLRGLKYDIAVSSGILFISLSIYSLLLVMNNKKNKLPLFFSGIFIGFIVCSKPTYIIYYLLILFIIIYILKNCIDKKSDILYLVIPLSIIAVLQMLYNYLRYDSIFEFGAKYQLTGFNLLEYTKCSLSRIFRGMKYYFFQTPKIDFHRFPYIFMYLNNDNRLYDDFLYEANFIGLISFPVIIVSLLISFISKNEDKVLKFLRNILWILLITYFIMIIINSTFAGVSEIYSIEAKVLMILASTIYFIKYASLHSKSKLIKLIFILMCLTNIIIILPMSYSGEGLCFLNLIK